MRLLFVGDVVGRPGRDAIHGLIPALRTKHQLDAVIVNCENAAAGRGVTPDLAKGFLSVGVDVLTSGNHIWAYKEIIPYIENEPRLIRPANYPNAPGRGSYRLKFKDGRTLLVIQVEGRIFMRNLECPFASIKRELEHAGRATATFLDIHAEATSEKQAIAWHFDGQISAIAGTHTHVQTADERLLPCGTAFITDAGMTGPHDSVIGMAKEEAIERLLTQRQTKHEIATDNIILCGIMVDINDHTGHAVHIERIREPWAAPAKY